MSCGDGMINVDHFQSTLVTAALTANQGFHLGKIL